MSDASWKPVGVPVPAELSLAEWIVLTLIDESPRHGFAVAGLTSEHGEIGAVWTIGRPVVYRAANRLVELGLVEVAATESGNRGPRRSVLTVSPEGRDAVRDWLARPVSHVRDVRSELLVKLALLDRRGHDHRPLVRVQHAQLAPLAANVQTRVDEATGFARVLASWRAENFRATLRFLDDLTTSPANQGRSV